MITIHLTTKDTTLRADGGRLFIKNETVDVSYAFRYIKAIYLGPAIVLDTLCIAACFKHDIPLYFCRGQGYIYGSTYTPGYGSGSGTILKQLKLAGSTHGSLMAAGWLALKFQRRISLLEKMKIKILRDIPALENCQRLEGSWDAWYWKVYLTRLSESRINRRHKRMAADTWNASLNYLYGMLYYLIEREILRAHLEPYLGFHHGMARRQKAFLFDVIEPFRPYCEEILWELQKPLLTLGELENNELSPEWRKILASSFYTFIYKKNENRVKRIKIIHRFIKGIAKDIEKYEQ
ncbi:CRISPR-associated endonuclease Cas1 [Jiulongibacter sediminis]|uniref:CRISPR-associated endonuclease Cas1 n=1 Tax=Jiulongibacter sediminis TaxID=1605367 RepID=UPI0026EEC581|nr:CRISPR-associated endonuclease Cas1 [Jiulongibacter sediminis]